MRVAPECIPCYLKQALAVMKAAGVKEIEKNNYLTELFPLISTLDRNLTPAENSSIILHYLYKLLKTDDPFVQAKIISNNQALTLVSHLLEIITSGKDPLLMALKIAVAGNIIDLGILQDYDLKDSLRNALLTRYPRCDYAVFLSKLQKASKVLVIGDNSGEIVFDRLFLEQLQLYMRKSCFMQ